MSAPTLWEEGRMSGSRVTRLAVLVGLLLLGLDLALSRGMTPLFDVGFVLLCAAAALAVRPEDFFRVGVLPPLLLLGLVAPVAAVRPGWLGDPSDGFVQALVSGLAHRATALFAGYLLALAVLALRQRVYAKRSGSPAPTRTTSGSSPERSTTVVGSDPHSPESITASSS